MALYSHINVYSKPVKAMAFDKAMVVPYLLFRFSIVTAFLSWLYRPSASVGLAPLKASRFEKLVSDNPISISTFVSLRLRVNCAPNHCQKALTKSRQSEALSARENIEILFSCHFH